MSDTQYLHEHHLEVEQQGEPICPSCGGPTREPGQLCEYCEMEYEAANQ